MSIRAIDLFAGARRSLGTAEGGLMDAQPLTERERQIVAVLIDVQRGAIGILTALYRINNLNGSN